MAFSLSGSTITQTGTDVNLSGLSGISGVSTAVFGGVTHYNVGARAINFAGNQTVNGRVERVYSSFSPGNYVFQVSGTMTINDTEDKSGDLVYFQDIIFHSTYTNSFCCGNYGFRVSSTGNLIMNGGYIRSDSSPIFDNGSRLQLTNAGFVSNTSNNTIQMRFFCADFDINGFFVKNFKFVAGVNALSSSNMSGLNLYGGTIATSGALTAGSPYTFSDFSSTGFGAGQQVDINDKNFINFMNAKNGSNLRLRGVINDSRAPGLYRNFKRLKINITDQSGPVDDVSIFTRDTDNGNRRDWTASNTGNDVTDINFTSDRTYFHKTQVAGNTQDFDVLLSVLARPTGGINDVVNGGLNTADVRGATGVLGEDKFIFNIWSYNHNFKQTDTVLNGTGDATISDKIFNDSNITEVVQATTQAYTTIDNSEMLYDYLKYMKTLNANIELPTADTLLLSASGTILTVPTGYTLVRDQTITNPVEIDGTNIKVKTGGSGLLKTAKFDTLSGTIDSSFNGNTDMQYVKTNGKVDVTFTSLNPKGFTLDPTFPASIGYKLATDSDYTRVSSDTLSDLTFEVDPSTAYDIIIRVPGYKWQELQINSGTYGYTQSANMESSTDLDGNDLFSKIGVQAEMDAVTYNDVEQKIQLENLNSAELTISFISAYIKFEQIVHNPGLVVLWENNINVNSTIDGFVIPQGNPTQIFLSAISVGDAFLSFTVKHSSGEDARDRFDGNASGNYISFATSVNNLSVPIPTAVENATATRTELATELARIDENVSAEKTTNIKKVNDVAVTDINDFKARIDTLNNISVADIEASTILAKEATLGTKASQTSIDALNDFNPSTDTVARVTLVDTTSVNTDMVDPLEMTEAELHAGLDSYANKNNWKADVSNLSADVNVVEVGGVAVVDIDDFKADVSGVATQANIASLNNISVGDIEGSTILAKETTLQSVKTKTDILINTDLTGIARTSDLNALNDLDQSDIHTALDNYTNKDSYKADVSDLSTDVNIIEVGGVTVAGVDDFKADTSSLATQSNISALNNISVTDIEGSTVLAKEVTSQGIKTKTDSLVNTDLTGIALTSDITSLNNFDPTTDVVANVTLVDTVTTNTDMRGTDGANTLAPDNTSIADILADTNELQVNQNNWTTAIGFATPLDVTSAKTAVIERVVTNENKIDNLSLDEVELHNALDTYVNKNDFKADTSSLATQASITALNDFNPATDIVANVALVDTTTSNSDMRGTDNAITTLSGIATSAEIGALNDVSVSDIESSTVIAKQSVLDTLVDYHDNTTKFFGQDGTTEVTQDLAYKVKTYAADGITVLKTIEFRDAGGFNAKLPEATSYVKV